MCVLSRTEPRTQLSYRRKFTRYLGHSTTSRLEFVDTDNLRLGPCSCTVEQAEAWWMRTALRPYQRRPLEVLVSTPLQSPLVHHVADT